MVEVSIKTNLSDFGHGYFFHLLYRLSNPDNDNIGIPHLVQVIPRAFTKSEEDHLMILFNGSIKYDKEDIDFIVSPFGLQIKYLEVKQDGTIGFTTLDGVHHTKTNYVTELVLVIPEYLHKVGLVNKLYGRLDWVLENILSNLN